MKQILISGAGTGIGRAAALRLAKDDGEFHLIGRTRSTLEGTSAMLNDMKVKSHIYCIDTSSEKDVTQFFKNAKAFDISINNAAIEGAINEIHKLTLEDFDETFNINVRAVFHFIKEEIRLLREANKSGHIINIASIAGIIGIPTSSIYCASKAALISLTKTAAAEQARHGIYINAICPGATDTPMLNRILGDNTVSYAKTLPLGRIGTVEEMAEAVAWLCNENTKFVIGQSIIIDGGATIG